MFKIGLEKFKDNILNKFGTGIVFSVEKMLKLGQDYFHLDNIFHALDHFEDLELSAELIADFLNSFEGTFFVCIFVFCFENDT